MAAFPTAPGILIAGYSETIDPAVLRSATERGLPRQRLASTHTTVTLTCTLHFRSRADADQFEDWYFHTIQRIGRFDFVHPRSGQSLSVRLVGGAIGPLTPLDNTGQHWRREISVEYLK